MKEEMVVGFAIDLSHNKVVLLRKNRPDWQKGRLNGVGGHINEGEVPQEAMRREFLEEAGLYIKDWSFIGTMEGNTWRVHIYTTCITNTSIIESKTDEEIVICDIDNLGWFGSREKPCIPNVSWLVPMCVDRMMNPHTYKVAHFWY